MISLEAISSIYDQYQIWINVFVVASLVFPILAILSIVLFAPVDFWLHSAKRARFPLIQFIRNIVALPVILTGIVLCFLPGQGLLLVLVGFAISDLPLKSKMTNRLLRNKQLRVSIDRLRTLANKKKFLWPDDFKS